MIVKYPYTLLSDVYWFQEGPGVRNTQFKNEGIKLLNGANILKSGYLDLNKTTRFLSEIEIQEKYKHFLCDVGDLVIASSGISFDSDGLLRTRGAFITQEHTPLCMNTSTIRFKSINQNSLQYLKHWLQSYEFRRQISRYVTGSAQQNFGPTHLKKIKIQLPPLTEQNRIAKLLDTADHIIRLREQTIAKLDALVQSVFVDMFGDLKKNSKKWKEIEFSALADNEDYKRKPIKSSERDNREGLYPYYGASGIIDSIDDYIFEGDSLLIGEDGANLLARSSPIAFMARGKYWVNNHAHILRQNKNANLRFLEFFLLNTDLKPYITGSTQPKLTRGNLDKIRVPTPPLELQNKFEKFVQKFEEQKSLMILANSTDMKLIYSLQYQSFVVN